MKRTVARQLAANWLISMGGFTPLKLDLLEVALCESEPKAERLSKLPKPGGLEARCLLDVLSDERVPMSSELEQRMTNHRIENARNLAEVGLSIVEIDQIGRIMSGVIDDYRDAHNVGPTWSEIFATGTLYPLTVNIDHARANLLMPILGSRGWIVTTGRYRSACAGPTAYVEKGRDVRIRSSRAVGERVAHEIGVMKSMNHQTPGLAEVHSRLQIVMKQQFQAEDKQFNQARWLTELGWIEISPDGSVGRGQRARSLTSELRSQKRAAANYLRNSNNSDDG